MTAADIAILICAAVAVVLIAGAWALVMGWIAKASPYRIPGEEHKQDTFGYLLPTDYKASHGERK